MVSAICWIKLSSFATNPSRIFEALSTERRSIYKTKGFQTSYHYNEPRMYIEIKVYLYRIILNGQRALERGWWLISRNKENFNHNLPAVGLYTFGRTIPALSTPEHRLESCPSAVGAFHKIATETRNPRLFLIQLTFLLQDKGIWAVDQRIPQQGVHKWILLALDLILFSVG